MLSVKVSQVIIMLPASTTLSRHLNNIAHYYLHAKYYEHRIKPKNTCNNLRVLIITVPNFYTSNHVMSLWWVQSKEKVEKFVRSILFSVKKTPVCTSIHFYTFPSYRTVLLPLYHTYIHVIKSARNKNYIYLLPKNYWNPIIIIFITRLYVCVTYAYKNKFTILLSPELWEPRWKFKA